MALFDRFRRFVTNQSQGSARPAPPPSQAARPTRNLRQTIKQSVLQHLGPLGGLVRALLRPNGTALTDDIDAEMEANQELRELLSQSERVPIPEAPAWFRGHQQQRGTNAPNWQQPLEFDEPPHTSPMSDSRFWLAPEEALIEPETLVQSSNVWSISYRHKLHDKGNGDLLVRFRSNDKARSGPGSRYAYRNVPYRLYQQFLVAASKGKWVWDELRVRGSIIGHQYEYDLIEGQPDGYVPRQIGFKRGQSGVWYNTRSLGNRRSTLPERRVSRTNSNLPGWDRRGTLRFRRS